MPTRERFLLRQAYGGTGRPDKCLVVSSLSPRLRPGCPRNTVDNAATTRAGLAPVCQLSPDQQGQIAIPLRGFAGCFCPLLFP